MTPPLDTNSKKELKNKIIISLYKFRKYLIGPVPRDMLLGPPEFDEQAYIADEIIKSIENALQTAHNSALDGARERIKKEYNEYGNGEYYEGFETSLDRCLAIIEELKQ